MDNSSRKNTKTIYLKDVHRRILSSAIKQVVVFLSLLRHAKSLHFVIKTANADRSVSV